MKSSTLRVLGKRKSPLPQRPIPNTNNNSKTKTAETNIAAGTHNGGTSLSAGGDPSVPAMLQVPLKGFASVESSREIQDPYTSNFIPYCGQLHRARATNVFLAERECIRTQTQLTQAKSPFLTGLEKVPYTANRGR